MEVRKVPGWCALCRSRCGTINTIEGGRLVAVAANPEHPTGRAICPKGKSAPEIAHSSRRLQRPLKRTRPKTDTDPGWIEISWETALEEIASTLNTLRLQHGPESVAFALSSPSGTALSDSFEWILRFIRLFGSPNICDAMELCNWQKDHAHKFTFGYGIPTPEFEKSDLIMLWGYNPASSWLAHSGAIAQAQANGAKVIVVDPKQSGHALQTEHWLRLRPGTDGALALGLANLIIRRQGYNEDFVRKWTNAPFLIRNDTGLFVRGRDVGMEGLPDCFIVWDQALHAIRSYDPFSPVQEAHSKEFALRGIFHLTLDGEAVECAPAFDHYAKACDPYTLDRVAEITGLQPQVIEDAATSIITSERVSYHCWTGIAQQANATQTERAMALLYALTGCFDAEGGNVRLNRQPVNIVNDLSLLAEEQRKKALGISDRPLGPAELGVVTASDLYTAILDGRPYPIRALVAFGSNILASRPEPGRGQQALEKLEFQVHADMFMTPSAQYADIVLPVNSLWEREALRIGFEISAEAEELIQLRSQMVPSQGDSKSDLWIIFQLAMRLGLREEFFHGDIEAGWNHILAPIGLTVEELRASFGGIKRPVEQQYKKYADMGPRGVSGFPTETRRVEIYSELLARTGYPPVPVFSLNIKQHADQRDTRYPYTLTNRRSGYFCHSQHRGITSLRRRALFPIAELSSEIAQEKGISEGQWIMIETAVGRAKFKAHIDGSLLPDVLLADYGWWQSCHDLGLPGYDVLGSSTSNYNVLTPADEIDPVSGAVPLRATRCNVFIDTQDEKCTGGNSFHRFQVTELIAEAAGTVSVVLSPEDEGRLPDFLPGQHLTVKDFPLLPGLARSYSLSSSARDVNKKTYRITVKRVASASDQDGVLIEGAVSTFINKKLKCGDVLSVSGPKGVFCLPTEPDFPVVMIASGIGITPFISYLETLANLKARPSGALYYGNRSSETHAFKLRLQELQAKASGIRIINYYSQPLARDRRGVDYDMFGRITADAIDQKWITRRARFYLCGTVAMLGQIGEGLVTRGVPRFEIFQEKFYAPVTDVQTNSGASYQIRFARSNINVEWTQAAGTILELAEKCGVVLQTGCRVGQCESCAVTVISGQVGHRVATDALDESVCLTCQSIPISNLVLDA